LRRRLVSADRFKDRAMRLGLEDLKTDGSRSSASLLLITPADQRRLGGAVRLAWRVDERVTERVVDEWPRAVVCERDRAAVCAPRALLCERPRAAMRLLRDD
jgi:hypothetical protein